MHARLPSQPTRAILIGTVVRVTHSCGRANEENAVKEEIQVSEKVADKKPRAKASTALGPNAEIGRKLKQYYESLVAEEVPDRFSQLLSRLENVETKLEGK